MGKLIIEGQGLVVWEEHSETAGEIVSPGGLKARAVATTLCLMPADHRRLRKLAVDRDVSMQTLLLDAIDLLMEREGQGAVERWETRRKER